MISSSVLVMFSKSSHANEKSSFRDNIEFSVLTDFSFLFHSVFLIKSNNVYQWWILNALLRIYWHKMLSKKGNTQHEHSRYQIVLFFLSALFFLRCVCVNVFGRVCGNSKIFRVLFGNEKGILYPLFRCTKHIILTIQFNIYAHIQHTIKCFYIFFVWNGSKVSPNTLFVYIHIRR